MNARLLFCEVSALESGRKSESVLAGRWRGLSRPVWLVLLGGVVSTAGSGATVPYLFPYLESRGLAAGLVGALLTVRAAGALAGAVLGGSWTDRLGIRRAVLLVLGASALSTAALTGIRGPTVAVLILAVYGVVGAALAAALGALLGQVASPEERTRAFALQYSLWNLGGAAGALAATVVLGMWPASGYVLLYGVDAATFVMLALIVWRWVPLPRQAEKDRFPEAAAEPAGGYRMVLRDRALNRVCLITALVVAAGFCQLHVGIPGFASASGLPVGRLGWVFAANMAAVVALQAPLQCLSKAWRRSTGAVAGVAVMAAAWGVAMWAPYAGWAALVAAGVAFAAGEVLLAPVLGVLVNDLASDRLRGRYNGAHTLAWTGGWLIGTALTGALLGIHRPGLLFPVLVIPLAVAAVATLRLRRHLPRSADMPPALIPRPDPALGSR
ncbi:MFS transporter [Streptomyces sp. NPDC085614]|uniref:MFS transporter n=1 Tax=Streptomyces sp. NPDC085614 TaxID=3365733 RepID=UPI0037D079C4